MGNERASNLVPLPRVDAGIYDTLHALTPRVYSDDASQTGFWVNEGSAVTCAHGFPDHRPGDCLRIDTCGRTASATIKRVDAANDIMLLATHLESGERPLPLSKDVLPGDSLYSWGYTQRNPKGESVTLEMEGWSRDPHLLKLKAGMVEPGMSGAPLYSTRVRAIIGMLKVTRDRNAPSGGRAVPISTILEVCELPYHGSETGIDAAAVAMDDVPTILGVFESAYESTRPRAAVERSLLASDDEEWPEEVEMRVALRDLEEHASRRRDAIVQWYRANPKCMRFIVLNSATGPRRVGATCVLPLHQRSYNVYRGGGISEFDLSSADIVPLEKGGKSAWLCFQSFGLSARATSGTLRALREGIQAHVLEMASDARLPRVIAEVGTKTGLREAKHFGMAFSGVSADKRPLFEVDLAAPSTGVHRELVNAITQGAQRGS